MWTKKNKKKKCFRENQLNRFCWIPNGHLSILSNWIKSAASTTPTTAEQNQFSQHKIVQFLCCAHIALQSPSPRNCASNDTYSPSSMSISVYLCLCHIIWLHIWYFQYIIKNVDIVYIVPTSSAIYVATCSCNTIRVSSICKYE